jgi:hypothetical protein
VVVKARPVLAATAVKLARVVKRARAARAQLARAAKVKLGLAVKALQAQRPSPKLVARLLLRFQMPAAQTPPPLLSETWTLAITIM